VSVCSVILPAGVNPTAVNKYIYIYIYHNAYLTSGLQFAIFGQQPIKRPSKIHKFLIARLVYYNNLFISCYESVIRWCEIVETNDEVFMVNQ